MRSGRMNRLKQRGSIEVVILIIVFAVVVGLIVWRYTEAEKAQMDAENAANSSEVIVTESEQQIVEIPEMSLAFAVPQNAGEITYDINESGAAQLKSSNLVDRSDCADDHDGKFALLRTANAEDANIDADLKMRLDDTEYVVQEDYQTCYTDEDRSNFDAVSIQIAQSLMQLNDQNNGTSSTTNPDEPVSNDNQE